MKYFEHLGHVFFQNKIKVTTLKLVYVLGKYHILGNNFTVRLQKDDPTICHYKDT